MSDKASVFGPDVVAAYDEISTLRADLAAAEARAAQFAARLRVAERVCEAVGMYESSTTAVVPYTEPKMRDAYVTWRNYIHSKAVVSEASDAGSK